MKACYLLPVLVGAWLQALGHAQSLTREQIKEILSDEMHDAVELREMNFRDSVSEIPERV